MCWPSCRGGGRGEPSVSWGSPFSRKNSCSFQKYEMAVFMTNGSNWPTWNTWGFLTVPIDINKVGWSMHHKGGSPKPPLSCISSWISYLNSLEQLIVVMDRYIPNLSTQVDLALTVANEWIFNNKDYQKIITNIAYNYLFLTFWPTCEWGSLLNWHLSAPFNWPLNIPNML